MSRSMGSMSGAVSKPGEESAAPDGDPGTPAAASSAPAVAPQGGPVPPAGVPNAVTARATWLLAPNPGPMTFDGTNSWVLHEPGQRGTVLVDPGPDDPAHLSALVDLAIELGGRVDAILLTHGHPDHSAGLRETARLTGAPILGARSQWADQVIGAGTLELAGLRIDVVPTPGHSSDSLSFHLPADETVLTGDFVLGRSAPVILDPDGRVDEFLDSLRLMSGLLGGGTPFFTALENWVNLNLVETRTFADGVLLTRYETRR